ncbi:uncharacterized protein LOC126746794 [Anthonomus grandis grandis]|uniref:uncharacterized protein LOC126746794 n=1 Tax=Anthonomus grandis grandis TaxID=2921223 RepID=UPI002165F09B|nr:uncharacterized protein LOC126746794 [Anthonomus grandis grandis]
MKFISFLFIVPLVTLGVYSQRTILNCHRCFGNSYCNDADHPDFRANVANATCNFTNTLGLDPSLDHPLWSHLQEALNKETALIGEEASPHTFEGNCVTATVFEPHDTHTLRSCIIRDVTAGANRTLCELLASAVQTQNVHNGTFSCRECNRTNFCNTHTLRVGDGVGGGAGTCAISLLLIGVMSAIRIFSV